MAPLDPRALKPAELARLLNSTPLGEVVKGHTIYRQRNRAGYRIGDGSTADLVRYVAWLAREVHEERPAPKGSDYEDAKERARARNARLSTSGRDVAPLPEVVDPARKERACGDFRFFCEAYFPSTFYLPWSDDHVKVMGRIAQAVLHGGLFALAMPRGSGKTSLCERACIWAILYGHRRFVCLIGSDYAWDAGATTLTLTWQASPSPDVATYRVREGLEPLDLDGTPVQESAALSYQRVFTDESGTFVWSVRAVDVDGNEERNVTHALALAFQDGSLVVRPAEPRMVEVYPAAGGALTVEFLYDPRYEDPAPAWGAAAGEGGAAEARIYWDAGTGMVDFDTPVGTVGMNGPTSPARYTWTSAGLIAGVAYLWVVRIATATGTETQNVRPVASAAPDSAAVPGAPDMSVTVV